jgi:hypothetical protein
MAAGISIDFIEQHLGENQPIIRVMPNTPAMVGEGMTSASRNGMVSDEMMEAVKNKEIKCLFFYRLDRISRNVKDFSEIKQILEDYDVNFYSASENFENITPSGKAMIMMTSVFAQLERDTLAERVRDNMLELAKTGRWLGGTTPTGYKAEAVESIKKYICCEKPIQRHCQDSCLDEIENCPYSLAIEAMEKQIPKKVITEYGEIFDCDKNGNETRFVFNFCPSCKIRFIRYGMKHCSECGQALDWSE